MFSQTVEYALRAMMHLASIQGSPQTADRIATQTQVPAGYLSKVMRDLVQAGLVTSSRGPGGGFLLSSRANDITVLEVINAVDPIRRIHQCPLKNPEHTELCPLHRRIDETLAAIEDALRTTTLFELIAQRIDQSATCGKPRLKTNGGCPNAARSGEVA